MVVGLIPSLITPLRGLRGVAFVALVSAVELHGVVQRRDGVVVATRFGRHWLLATPQALLALRRSVGSGSGRWAGTWLGFRPTGDQQRWLRRHEAKDSMGVDL